MQSRRTLLRRLGTAGVGIISAAALSPSVGADEIGTNRVCKDGCKRYPVKTTTSNTYNGYDIRGDKMMTSLGTSLTEYAPVYRPSNQNWEFDFTVSGTSVCRYPNGTKARSLWWQEANALNFSKDLYSRMNNDWIASDPNDTNPGFDYSDYGLAVNALSLAVGAVNPAAGTGISAGYFLSEMANWVSDVISKEDYLRRKWDYDTAITTGQFADAGTFVLFRDELPPGSTDSVTFKNFAVAQNENVVSTEFSVSFDAPPKPASMSDLELREEGIRSFTPAEGHNSSRAAALSGRETIQTNETVYIADVQQNVEVDVVEDPTIPDRIYEEIDEHS